MSRRSVLSLLLVLVAGVGLWFAAGKGAVPPAVDGERAPESLAEDRAEAPISADGPTLAPGADSPEGGPVPGDVPGVVQAGRVVDAASGQPIPGALIVAFRSGSRDAARLAHTDEAGRFSVGPLDRGAWLLLAWHALYVPAGLEALLSAPKGSPPPDVMAVDVSGDGAALPERELRLSAGRRIEGRVVGAAGGPAARVRVQLFRGKSLRRLESRVGLRLRGWQEHLPLWTNAEGRFALACLPPSMGEVRLGASQPGHVCAWSAPIPLDPADAPAEPVLTLLPTATIRGHVRLADGAPAVGSEVDLENEWALRRRWLFEDVIPAEVAADGTYALSGLPAAEVDLSACWMSPYLAGPDRAVDALEPGEVRRDIDFTLPRRYVMRARLRSPDGEPLFGERLELWRANVSRQAASDDEPVEWGSTDGEGRVVLAVDSAGPFVVVHAAPGGDAILQGEFVLPADELELKSEGATWTRIVLHATGPDGVPLARFRSSVWSLAGDAERNAAAFDSDVDGRDGRAEHRVRGAPPFAFLVGQAEDERGRALDLSTMRTRVKDVPADGVVRIQLQSSGLVQGRFVDVEGQAVSGARLTLVIGKGDDAERLPVPVRKGGDFSFELPRGVAGARVVIQVPPGFVRLRSFHVDRDNGAGRELVLIPGGSISGRVVTVQAVDFGSSPLVKVSWYHQETDPAGLAYSARVAVDPDGRFEVAGVPSGRDLKVRLDPWIAAEHGLRSPDREVTTSRAGAPGLELRLVPGLSIRGQVTGPGAATSKGWRVVALPLQEDLPVALAQVGPDGVFELKGLSAIAYRLRLQGRSGTRLGIQNVEAGNFTVRFRVGALGEIPVRVDVAGGFTLEAYTAGSVTLRARVYADEGAVVLTGLPADERYDLVVTDDWEGRVGFHAGVQPGDAVTVKLVEPLSLAGRLQSAKSLEHSQVYARGAGCCFWLMVDDDSAFQVDVAPGNYDIVVVERDGTEHVVARDVAAGSEGLELVLKD